MIELSWFAWFMIGLDVTCLIGFVWAVYYSVKWKYPYLRREASVVGTFIVLFTTVLLLYLFGVIK